jgi:hypothetical protein
MAIGLAGWSGLCLITQFIDSCRLPPSAFKGISELAHLSSLWTNLWTDPTHCQKTLFYQLFMAEGVSAILLPTLIPANQAGPLFVAT